MKVSPVNPAQAPVVLTPLYSHSVAAGFPSPADDHLAQRLDLNQHLIQHPAATYFLRADGESMRDVGIFSGDLLVVDNSLKPRNGDVVVAAVDGQLTCKILNTRLQQLVAANPSFPPIYINSTAELIIEGVVVASVRYHRAV